MDVRKIIDAQEEIKNANKELQIYGYRILSKVEQAVLIAGSMGFGTALGFYVGFLSFGV